METAPVRGLAQKEPIWIGYPIAHPSRFQALSFNYQALTMANNALGASLHLDDPIFNPPAGATLACSNGLLHDGSNEAINDFLGFFFGGSAGPPPIPPTYPLQSDLDAVCQFIREFDTGVAPMIGQVKTLIGPGFTPASIAPFMEQVRVVNAGLAVTGRIGGTTRGFWYDAFPSGTPPNSGTFFDVTSGVGSAPAALLALMTAADDRLVFQSTPLGMDRRLASMSTPLPVLTGPAPSNVQLASMVPDTAWENVPSFEKNWDPTHTTPGYPFNWAFGTSPTQPWDLKALRLMQKDYMGVNTNRRHEPSRRFRVSGENIRHGAVLTIHVPQATPPTDIEFLLTLPLYPSDKLATNGNRIWETAVEADPLIAGMFAVGGYWSPGINPANSTSVFVRKVVDLINETAFTPGPYFNSAVWNQYTIDVTNEDGTTATATNQVITIEPAGFTH
jgi:hypothetical protein